MQGGEYMTPECAALACGLYQAEDETQQTQEELLISP